MRKFLKKKWVKFGLLPAAVIVIVYLIFTGGEKTEYVFAEVTRGDIVQTVSVTGSIKADPTIDLHFQKSGKVNEILVKEGEKVKEGQLLATLENKSLELEIKRNQANVNLAQAQYNQTKAGAKYEEIKIAEAEVASAQAAYDSALTELENIKGITDANVELAEIAYKQAKENADAALKDLLTTTELAEKEIAKLELGGSNIQTVALDNAYSEARAKTDALIALMQESIYLAEDILGINGTGYQLITSSEKNRIERNYYNPADADYEDAVDLYNDLTTGSSQDEIDDAVDAAIEAGNSVLTLMTQIGIKLQSITVSDTELENLILNVTTKSTNLSSGLLALTAAQTNILNIKVGAGTDIETLKLNYQLQIDAAESKYNTAVNTLNKAIYDLKQAELNATNADKNAEAQAEMKKAALDAAKATLAFKKSPARDVDLATLAAQITQAKIALEIAENEYKDSQMTAPVNGVVTFIHGEVGENISLSETALYSFLTIQVENLIVEANVPETDVTKIEVGDKVEMTIDAFDFTEKFEGKVIYVDPAETVIQGVIYYGIKTAFELEDERLKSGMTTNLDIVTDKKEDVLMIPSRAIKYEDSTRYVEVLANGAPKRVTITTGLESDQFTEILSGLKEGDQIITFTK
jgi:RND family efflux transporter MFP subunit